jgi:formylglycine-generating enzyme required for sulfatase activity
MQAYAEWRGGRLPTEAEWEYAASAGQPATTEQPREANSWQGAFPIVNAETDGFKGLAPVGCYAPNGNGLYDMVGNAWEVTADFFRPGHDPAATNNPRGPSENAAYDPLNPGSASRVMKGGSFLCAPNYCQRYRPAARQGRDPGLGASNVGFRLAYDRR